MKKNIKNKIKNLVNKHKLLHSKKFINPLTLICPVIKLAKKSTYTYDCPHCDAATGFGGKQPIPKKVVNMTCDSCGYEGDSTDFKLILS